LLRDTEVVGADGASGLNAHKRLKTSEKTLLPYEFLA
jgi:hypothetical protein